MHILLEEYYRRYRNVWKPEAKESYLEKKFLEDIFWDVLQILKRENTLFDLQPQFPFKCRENKTRRVDFVYRIGNWSIAFELDGSTKLERENRTLNRDAFNDLIRRQNDLLNVVDDLLRFTYDDIHFNKDKCVKIIVERCRKYIDKEKTNENENVEKRLEEKLKIFAESYSKAQIEEIKKIISNLSKEKESVVEPKTDVSPLPSVSYRKNIMLVLIFMFVSAVLSMYFYSNVDLVKLLNSDTEFTVNQKQINRLDDLEKVYTQAGCLSASSYKSDREFLLCGQGSVNAYDYINKNIVNIPTNVNLSENILSCFYNENQKEYYLGLDNGEVVINGNIRHLLYPNKHIISLSEAHSHPQIVLSVKHHGIVSFDISNSTIVDSMLFSSNIYAILKGKQPNQYYLGDANGQLNVTDYSNKTSELINISDNPIRAISFASNQKDLLVGDNAGNLYFCNLSEPSNIVLIKSFSRPILYINNCDDEYVIILEGGIIYKTKKI